MGKVKVMLLASEWSSKHGGLSTFNRELAIHLAKHPEVEVFFFLPKCDQAETEAAKEKHITLVQAEQIIGVDELQWLCHPPKWLQIDFVIGHGVVLGCQAQIIRKNVTCKWIQFVHTDPEELGMFKDYPNAVLKGEEKHQTEVKLCEMADLVVTVGPKLAEEYRSHLQYCKKDVFEFTPGIFSEFSDVVQSNDEGRIFRVLLFGRGDGEDFHLKGFDIAARAVAKLHDARLIFVGAKSKEQDEVTNRLKECNLPARQLRVKAYMEIRDELKKPFSGADLAIMPSRTEGFGLATLEALSAGLPILVSGNSGFGQALGKVTFGAGCVIPPEDAEDAEKWAQKIKEIKAKPRKTRLQESKWLLQNYAEDYNWQTQTGGLVEKMMAIRNGEPGELEGRKGSGSEQRSKDSPSTSSSAGPKKRKRDSLSTEEPAPKTSKTTSSSNPSDADHAEDATSEISDDGKRGEHGGSKGSGSEPPSKGNKKPVSGDKVKVGCPSEDELEELSMMLSDNWGKFGRRLGFAQARITAFHKENEKLSDKAYAMLMEWKEREGSDGTYKVLYDALCHKLVNYKRIAEKICCV